VFFQPGDNCWQLAILGLALLWRMSPLKQWLTLDNLLAAADSICGSVLAIPIVLGIFVVGSCLMIPVNLLILATALSFGSIKGFSLALAGSLLGGLASYLLGRWLGREVVRKLAGKKLNRMSRQIARRGWLAVALLRMVPIAPFTLINGRRCHAYFDPFLPDWDRHRPVSRNSGDNGLRRRLGAGAAQPWLGNPGPGTHRPGVCRAGSADRQALATQAGQAGRGGT